MIYLQVHCAPAFHVKTCCNCIPVWHWVQSVAHVLLWCCRWWRQRLRQRQRLHRGLPHGHGRCRNRSPGCGSRPERPRRQLCLPGCPLCSPANHAGPLSPGTPPTMEIMLEELAKHGQQGYLSFFFFFFFCNFCIQQIKMTVKQTAFRLPASRLVESASRIESSHASWFPTFPKIVQCHALTWSFTASLHQKLTLMPAQRTLLLRRNVGLLYGRI